MAKRDLQYTITVSLGAEAAQISEVSKEYIDDIALVDTGA